MDPTRILLVNDSSLVRQLIGKLLAEPEGVHIAAAAADGEMALRLLQRQRFDLVLLDVEMPVMDGFAVLRRLRENARFAKLPVVAVTANAMQGAEEIALRAGFSAYITSPTRSRTPSFWKMLVRCVFTVRSLMVSWCPTFLFL